VKQLFDGCFAPVTFGFAFLRVPFLVLVDEYVSWTKKNHPNTTVEPMACSFRKTLERLAPLTAPTSKELLIGAGTEWTALLSNGLGSDAFARAPYWSSRLGIDTLALDCIPDKKDRGIMGARGRYRAMQIQVFLGATPDKPRRTLSSLHDGDRWTFINEGDPFSFEDVAKFSARAVRDRVSPADIEAFCLHFGTPTSETGFSGPAAIISTHRSGIGRSLSYQEAQADLGIEIDGVKLD
jgi:hypothetical protein